MQQVSRSSVLTQQDPRTKSAPSEFEEQNQNATSSPKKSTYKEFYDKNQHATSSMNKKRNVRSSMNKIGFTRRKIYVQFSRRKNHLSAIEFHCLGIAMGHRNLAMQCQVSTVKIKNKDHFLVYKFVLRVKAWENS